MGTGAIEVHGVDFGKYSKSFVGPWARDRISGHTVDYGGGCRDIYLCTVQFVI